MPQEMLEITHCNNAKVRCEDRSIITDIFSGEVICSNCGIVLAEESESPGQYQAYSQTRSVKNRTAATSLAMHDMGLPTMIDFKNKDASGKTLSEHTKNQFSRLRTWDMRSKNTHVEKNLKFSLATLDSLKANLWIPDTVVERAAQIYRKAVLLKITRGRSITSMICASLYAACREYDIPRTLSDIATAANLSKKILSRSYRTLIKELDLNPRPYDSSEFINKIASHAKISEKIRRDALEILSRITKKEIHVGKNPLGIASSVLYLSCVANGEKTTQESIARASGITPVTIRNTVSGIRKKINV